MGMLATTREEPGPVPATTVASLLDRLTLGLLTGRNSMRAWFEVVG